MFSLFKKKRIPQNPEISEYKSKIDQLDMAILDKGLRPSFAGNIIITRIYNLPEFIRKTKFIITLFDSEIYSHVTILAEREQIPYSEFIGHTYKDQTVLRESLLILLNDIKLFLDLYEKFRVKETLSLLDQNKSKLFILYFIQVKEFIDSISNIGK